MNQSFFMLYYTCKCCKNLTKDKILLVTDILKVYKSFVENILRCLESCLSLVPTLLSLHEETVPSSL